MRFLERLVGEEAGPGVGYHSQHGGDVSPVQGRQALCVVDLQEHLRQSTVPSRSSFDKTILLFTEIIPFEIASNFLFEI